jgi:hypothetical protein
MIDHQGSKVHRFRCIEFSKINRYNLRIMDKIKKEVEEIRKSGEDESISVRFTF